MDAGLPKEVPVARLVLDAKLPQNAKNLVIRDEPVGEIPRVVDFGVVCGFVVHWVSKVGDGLGAVFL
jgi:hypothetical protein